jgi:hypothetical protein
MRTNSMTMEFQVNRPKGLSNTEDTFLIRLIDEIENSLQIVKVYMDTIL